MQLSLKTFGNEGKQLESYRPFLFQGLGNLDEPACSGTSDAPGKGRLKAGQLEQQGEVSWLKTLTHGVVFVLLRPYKIFGSFALEGPLTSVILLEIPHSTASAQSRRLGGIASNKPCKRPTMSQVTKLLLQSLASTVVFQEHFFEAHRNWHPFFGGILKSFSDKLLSGSRAIKPRVFHACSSACNRGSCWHASSETSLVRGKGCLDQADFHDRFEKEILREDTMDGTRQGGKYGWTAALLLMG